MKIKTPLTLSILLNGLLVVALGISLAQRGKPIASPATAAVSEPPPAPPVETAKPFRWSQLEATNDYRSYVANLRAVGCPEPTIRAIVTADFAAAISFEKHHLELAGKSTSQFSPETTKQAVASVLGETAGSSHAEETATPATAITTAHTQLSSVRPAGQPVFHASYPVVFQNAALNDSSLMENQKAAVRQLQQQFVDAIGSANQDPADPVYTARWQTAQQDADDALRAQLGNQAYLAYKQQHYYSNFQQVILNADGGPVTINPEELAQ
jgi:hypothetical protein